MSKSTPKTVVIPAIEKSILPLRLIGDSPLVTHAWSEKAKKEMRDKQMKKARAARAAKDPEAEFNGARYRMADGADGFPAAGVKLAIAVAGRYAEGVTMVSTKQAIHVNLGQHLVPIQTVDGRTYGVDLEPELREDLVRVGGKGPGTGTADLRYRPEYAEWSIPVKVMFNSRVFTAEQIFNLAQLAGFHIGLGENRAEKGGSWGMFHVVADEVAE